MDGSIFIGGELKDDILSKELQRSIMKLKRWTWDLSMMNSQSKPQLLDSTHEGQIIPRKISKHLDKRKHDLNTHKQTNCWDHIAVWCMDDNFVFHGIFLDD